MALEGRYYSCIKSNVSFHTSTGSSCIEDCIFSIQWPLRPYTCCRSMPHGWRFFNEWALTMILSEGIWHRKYVNRIEFICNFHTEKTYRSIYSGVSRGGGGGHMPPLSAQNVSLCPPFRHVCPLPSAPFWPFWYLFSNSVFCVPF